MPERNEANGGKGPSPAGILRALLLAVALVVSYCAVENGVHIPAALNLSAAAAPVAAPMAAPVQGGAHGGASPAG